MRKVMLNWLPAKTPKTHFQALAGFHLPGGTGVTQDFHSNTLIYGKRISFA